MKNSGCTSDARPAPPFLAPFAHCRGVQSAAMWNQSAEGFQYPKGPPPQPPRQSICCQNPSPELLRANFRPNLLPNDGSFMSQFKTTAQEKQVVQEPRLEESMKQFLSEVGATPKVALSAPPSGAPAASSAGKVEGVEQKTREPIKRRSRRTITSATSSGRRGKTSSRSGIEAALLSNADSDVSHEDDRPGERHLDDAVFVLGTP
eukprot:scaffold1199_cov265-Pinguiococcus_pyrenoidosus.AAC.43